MLPTDELKCIAPNSDRLSRITVSGWPTIPTRSYVSLVALLIAQGIREQG
jgi:hypothetical protein